MPKSPSAGERAVERPTLFFLHYLGGSAREWAQVARRLENRFDLVTIDLPGFGDASREPGYAVAEMATYVAHAVRNVAPRRWMLVGHSMGAKVAAVLARDAEDGTIGLTGLVGLVTIAGSPPGPEPIPDADRIEMLGWFGGDDASRLAEAREFVTRNRGRELERDTFDAAVSDVLRASPLAWRAWLTSGSREDWAQRVGVLRTPTLAIAGVDDANLGPDAQRRLLAPHFARVRLETVANAKHLLPYEAPDEIARLIDEHATECIGDETYSLGSDAYRVLIASDRVSHATRRALLERGRPDDPTYEPMTLSSESFALLRAVVARLVPQTGPTPIDLAARIDRQLASGTGNGWRYADLPTDVDAYRAGLETLRLASTRRHGADFAALDDGVCDAMLTQIASGAFEPVNDDDATSVRRLNAAQMRLWFEDVREDAVRCYVAHPQTLDRMGYSGIANGGDGLPKSGFVRVGYGEREPWEPLAASDRTS